MDTIRTYFTTYRTRRVVKIPNTFLAATYFTLVFIILLYIGLYVIYRLKHYQISCPVVSVVSSEVKGSFSTENYDQHVPNIYKRVWDANDLTIVSNDGGFTIITDKVMTPNQTQGVCPGFADYNDGFCDSDENCKKDKILKSGTETGKCNEDTNTCEIKGWCPVALNVRPLGNKPLFSPTKDFVVEIRNSVEFPGCGKGFQSSVGNLERNSEINMLPNKDKNKQKPHKLDKQKVAFTLEKIVSDSGHNFSKVTLSGAIFAMKINWQCDFDMLVNQTDCQPTYSFLRLDEEGYSFYSVVYHENDRRTLTKNYGIKIHILVDGDGKMFSAEKCFIALGASLGVLSLAKLMCDLLFDLFCHLKKCATFPCLESVVETMKYDSTYITRKSYHIDR